MENDKKQINEPNEKYQLKYNFDLKELKQTQLSEEIFANKIKEFSKEKCLEDIANSMIEAQAKRWITQASRLSLFASSFAQEIIEMSIKKHIQKEPAFGIIDSFNNLLGIIHSEKNSQVKTFKLEIDGSKHSEILSIDETVFTSNKSLAEFSDFEASIWRDYSEVKRKVKGGINPLEDNYIRTTSGDIKSLAFAGTIYAILTEQNVINVFDYAHMLIRSVKCKSSIRSISISYNEKMIVAMANEGILIYNCAINNGNSNSKAYSVNK